MSTRPVRVAVVVGNNGSPCHPRLEECALDVVAEVRTIDDLLRAPSHEHEVAIVGCTPRQLSDARFCTRLTRLSRAVPTVLVAPRITRTAAEVAARAHTLGLVARSSGPDEMSRAVRAVTHGRIAYPQEALALILRLVPPLPGHTHTPEPAT